MMLPGRPAMAAIAGGHGNVVECCGASRVGRRRLRAMRNRATVLGIETEHEHYRQSAAAKMLQKRWSRRVQLREAALSPSPPTYS